MPNLPRSIGAMELSSIGVGYQVEDEMLKAASVELLIARTICSGKYLIVIGGSVSDVEAAIQAGLNAAGEAIIDHLVIPNVHDVGLPGAGPIGHARRRADRRPGRDRDLQRHERPGRGRRRGQGGPRDPPPHPRRHGPGRQRALPDDRHAWPTSRPAFRPPPKSPASAGCSSPKSSSPGRRGSW